MGGTSCHQSSKERKKDGVEPAAELRQVCGRYPHPTQTRSCDKPNMESRAAPWMPLPAGLRHGLAS